MGCENLGIHGKKFWHQLRIYIMRCENLTIISDQNLKKNSIVKEIFPTVYHDYCMIHLFKNLMGDVWDKKIVKPF